MAKCSNYVGGMIVKKKPFLCIEDRKATGVRLSIYLPDQIILMIHAK